jgi:hypothetical protein
MLWAAPKKQMASDFEKISFKYFFFIFNNEGGIQYSARLQIYLQVLFLTFKSTPKSSPKCIAVKLHLEFVSS